MGTWGTGIFDDDIALDFLQDFEASGASVVLDAFTTVQRDSDAGYIDRDNGAMGLAAAEVVAASFGRPAEGLDEELMRQLVSHKDPVRALPSVVKSALLAVELVGTAPERSELLGLFADEGLEAGFLESVDDLRSRLGAIQP